MSQVTIKGEEYDMIKLLGHGGFGKVFEVKCGESIFAMKVESISNNKIHIGQQKEQKVFLD